MNQVTNKQDINMQSEVQNVRTTLLQRSYVKLREIYMKLPINFSFLTGWRYPGIPRLSGQPLLGRLKYLFMQDGIFNNLISAGKLASEHPSGMCYYWIATKLVLIITHPDHIKEILITNDKNISRRSATRFIEKFWGPSITTAPYEQWKQKRSIYLNHFAEHEALEKHEKLIQTVITKYLTIIAQQKQLINLRLFASDYVLENTLNLLIPHRADRNIKEFSDYTNFIGENVANMQNVFALSLPKIIRKLFFRNKNLDDIQARIKSSFNSMLLAPNESYFKTTENFVKSLWELNKNQAGQGSLLENDDVFGDSNALFFASQDTVMIAIEFCIKLLAAHPDIEQKLRNELSQHLTSHNITSESLNKLEYLDMIVKETLRLYPPAPLLPRGVDRKFKINNLILRKGDIITISPYLTHRTKNVWENPEKFWPERFTKENQAKIPAHAYLPFGDGRHGCIGWRFSYLQIKMMIAAIYLQYHVAIENNDFELTIERTTLRPKQSTLAKFIAV